MKTYTNPLNDQNNKFRDMANSKLHATAEQLSDFLRATEDQMTMFYQQALTDMENLGDSEYAGQYMSTSLEYQRVMASLQAAHERFAEGSIHLRAALVHPGKRLGHLLPITDRTFTS